MHRARVRWSKALLLTAGISLAVEGALELPRLRQAVSDPPSVPGESKIAEHFAIQHVAFPALIGALVFRPSLLRGLIASRAARYTIATAAVALAVPETVVSLQGDLFRPYPFTLPGRLLPRLEMTRVGGRDLNVIQAHHLLSSAWGWSAAAAALAVRPDLLAAFAGPRTSSGWAPGHAASYRRYWRRERH
jgi:hypothetical protein